MIIYDFDGTLTPYSLPKYEILKKCGYDDNQFMNLVEKYMNKNNDSLYIAYFDAYKDVLEKHGFIFNKETICYGADSVKFNSGINDYFNDLQYKNTGLKHFIITSGLKVYVENTFIAQYINEIFGTEFNESDGVYTNISKLVTNEHKVNVIRALQKTTKIPFDNIIYIGDGLTDKDAFEYVHNNGGTSILLCDDKEDDTYKQLNNAGIIDECFKRHFNVSSPLYQYIKNKSHVNYD